MNIAHRPPRNLVAALFVSALFCGLPAGADNYTLVAGQASVTTPPPPPAPNNDTSIDCRRHNSDARCQQPAPVYRPYPNYPNRRPVIINTTPPPPAVEIDSLKDDWEGCRSAKLSAINSRHDGKLEQANHLDEWLWKNCRSYSDELRDLEQNHM
jgi:hypothetical protein